MQPKDGIEVRRQVAALMVAPQPVYPRQLTALVQMAVVIAAAETVVAVATDGCGAE